MTDERRRWILLGPKPLRCRLGIHDWTGWNRRCAREYEPSPGSEGTIVGRYRQTRLCVECGEEETVAYAVKRYAPAEAIGYDLITEDERKNLRKRPLLGEIDMGVRIDHSDNVDVTAEVYGSGLLCRLGLHRRRGPSCVRCRHIKMSPR